MIPALLQSQPVPIGPNLALQAGLLLLLVALSAFFSGTEVALVSLSKLRRRQLAEEDHAGAHVVETLFEHPNRFLVTILIGNNLVNILAASIATSVAIGLFGSTGVGIATGVMTFLILTFGEITPKAYATIHNETWSLRAAPIILGLQKVLYPVVLAFTWFTQWMFGLFGAEGRTVETALRDEEELKTLITLGREEGILEEDEREMIHSVIEFGDTVAREIMVPRTDVVSVPSDATLEEARDLSLESGFSRIPVYGEDLDDVHGLLYVKDLIDPLTRGEGRRAVEGFTKDAYFVPETKRLDDLLRQMQRRRQHLAIVVDEFGGTAGIITMEDVLEEIVGDIFDEYDLRKEPVQRLDDNSAIADARVDVADLNETLGLDLPDPDHYESLGGLITHELGRLGRQGESVRLDGVELVVEKVSNRRILRVRIRKLPPADEGEGDVEEPEDGAVPPGSGEDEGSAGS